MNRCILALLVLTGATANASPLPFIAPETARDSGLKGKIKQQKSVFQCKARPLEEFNETSASYDEKGRLLQRSTISQNLNHHLHPQAGMGELVQTFVDDKLKHYVFTRDFNGRRSVIEAEVLKQDGRERPRLVKATDTVTDLEGETRSMISAHTFRYDGNMIVLGNKSKTSISPTVTFNSVIELNAQQRIVKHTVEDPFTKQLNVTYSASYEGDQVTEKQVEGRTAEYDYDEQGELTNVSTISGLGLANAIVTIANVNRDQCGNTLSATMSVDSPMKDKLDELFAIQRDAAAMAPANEVTADQSSDSFRLPQCQEFEMIAEYEYYEEC